MVMIKHKKKVPHSSTFLQWIKNSPKDYQLTRTIRNNNPGLSTTVHINHPLRRSIKATSRIPKLIINSKASCTFIVGPPSTNRRQESYPQYYYDTLFDYCQHQFPDGYFCLRRIKYSTRNHYSRSFEIGPNHVISKRDKFQQKTLKMEWQRNISDTVCGLITTASQFFIFI